MTSFWHYPVTQGFGPTNETLDSAYGGYSHFNKGYDFGTPSGTPVQATVGGQVISVGDAGDGWGTRVWVRDDQGYTHNYGHLSGMNVRQGDTVQAGQVIGSSGSTGRSTGPHVSYDVWDARGDYVDPGRFIGMAGQGGMQQPQQPQVPRGPTAGSLTRLGGGAGAGLQSFLGANRQRAASVGATPQSPQLNPQAAGQPRPMMNQPDYMSVVRG